VYEHNPGSDTPPFIFGEVIFEPFRSRAADEVEEWIDDVVYAVVFGRFDKWSFGTVPKASDTIDSVSIVWIEKGAELAWDECYGTLGCEFRV
jgi:hypothetical protein